MDLNVVQYIWQHNPGAVGEFRLIRDGKVAQQFYPKDNVNETVIRNFSYAWDTYFGVLPRLWEQGTNDAVSLHQATLWADFDTKTEPKDHVFTQVMRIKPIPQILVDSGRGYHAYWMLSRAIPRDSAQSIMRGIAQLHGGDHTYDAARVLRVPGTTNFKDGSDVRLLKFDTTVMYEESDFFDYAHVGMERIVVTPWHSGHIGQTTRIDASVPEWLTNLIKNTGNKKGTRSEEAFKVVCYGIRQGFSSEEIESWFVDNPQGIGQKYHEKRDGHRWFTVTFKAAQKSILSSKQRGF